MSIRDEALELHKAHHGKIEVISKVEVSDGHDLSLAYTPGVAEACKEIYSDPNKVFDYTNKGNMIAVVTDGSAVLGLGNIGSLAGMPVMEGKSVLFKEFGGVDAFPICLAGQDTETIIQTVKQIAPSFGGINLEDIAAPRCFEIEKRLIEELDIPVFHDDQHGTAVVVLAAVLNGLKLVGKKMNRIKIVISGAGAAGIAIGNLLMDAGATDVILCNRKGVIDPEDESLDPGRREVAEYTNPNKIRGNLATALEGADIFIGVSAPGVCTTEMVSKMNGDAIVLAMANPIPEIFPEDALAGGARIVGTGRSDFPNQVNNVLVFPGLFRGALNTRAARINTEMKLAAAHAIADLIPEAELREDYIIPEAFDKRVGPRVAYRVAKAAEMTGVARI